ncbi:glycosyltransferase [Bifidobacterium eulemuris]|uniref:Multidrug MFS transporter n=1 Tax=Bifidobacterium eulemuris TaxID=1765219 RepID=A0A261G5V0_9BIFI|nr:glycosyltransferase [Bifidobacterium eulemuris]OZG66575.1 multidrug MFS transporter [Bifidobacterium eulemuris]QOL32658.1 multidrug MFS transporter [Bifidobacterium eulemuris]
MIFVTVGTHEQPFDRLVRAVDELKGDGVIASDEQVFIQTGFSTYTPRHCEWAKLLPYQEMQQRVRDARIVITHGGPSSFLAPLRIGKIPIVAPRRVEYGEHVNDHQVDFTHDVAQRFDNIIIANDKNELADAIQNYGHLVADMSTEGLSHNDEFCQHFESLVTDLLPAKEA